MTDEWIRPLRQRMIEDGSLRYFGEKTEKDYIPAIKNLTILLGRPPDTATVEDLTAFPVVPDREPSAAADDQLHGHGVALPIHRVGSGPTLSSTWALVAEPREIPVVLSSKEEARLLEAAPASNTRPRSALSTSAARQPMRRGRASAEIGSTSDSPVSAGCGLWGNA